MSDGRGEEREYTPVPPVPSWAGQGAPRPARPGEARSISRGASSGGWLQVLSLVFLVVGCVAAPLALAGVYVHATLFDEDGYVAAMARVAAAPAVHTAVAGALSKEIAGALKDAGSSTGLGDEADAIAGALTEALPIADMTRRLVDEALASSGFASTWAEANRALHPLLLNVLEHAGDGGSGPVPIDLSAVATAVTKQLGGAGVLLPDPLPEELTSGHVPLVDSTLLRQLGTVIVTIDRLRVPLAVLAVVALAAGVVVAGDRLLAGLLAGAGVAGAMLGVQLALAVGRSSYVSTTDEARIPHAASVAVYDAVTRDLRVWAWGLLVLGVAAAVTCLVLRRVRSRAARLPAPR